MYTLTHNEWFIIPLYTKYQNMYVIPYWINIKPIKYIRSLFLSLCIYINICSNQTHAIRFNIDLPYKIKQSYNAASVYFLNTLFSLIG